MATVTKQLNSYKDDWVGEIKAVANSKKLRELSRDNFFRKRIKIKSFLNEIIPMVSKTIQVKHQKTKDAYVRAGRKPRFLLLKSRRMGFTTYEQAETYRVIASQENTTCATMAQTKPDAEKIFRMVSLMAANDSFRPGKPSDSKQYLEYKAMNSIFHIGTAGSKAFARGENLKRFHGSEVAHWDYNIEQLDNLMSGVIEAARDGEVILETTANGAGGWFYEKFKEAMEGGNNWIPLFYAWFEDPDNTIELNSIEEQNVLNSLEDEEIMLMEKHDLNAGQIAFRREKQLEHGKLFPQEFPESWEAAFLVRGSTFFDVGTLNKASKTVKPILNESNNITIWLEPIPGRQYCAGSDPSEGNTDSDNCVCGIIDRESGEQVAVIRGKWRPDVFAKKSIDLCKKYNNAVYACEINNHGHSVMNTIMNVLDYKNIYYRVKTIERDKHGNDVKEKKPGWETNGKTRPILLDELNEAIEKKYMGINDQVFIAEAKTFVDTGKKYEADSGENDDTIIAWGIAWQCRKQKQKTKDSYIAFI